MISETSFWIGVGVGVFGTVLFVAAGVYVLNRILNSDRDKVSD